MHTTHTTSRVLALSLLTLAAAMPAFAQGAASESRWSLTGRVASVENQNRDSTGLGLTATNQSQFELELGYAVAPQVSMGLALGLPTRHDVASFGIAQGTLKQMPATLMVRYHFDSTPALRPYVGLGLNVTRYSDVRLAGGRDVSGSSTGLAVAVGLDVPVARDAYLNFEVRKTTAEMDVRAAGAKLGTLRLNPTRVSAGVGWRF